MSVVARRPGGQATKQDCRLAQTYNSKHTDNPNTHPPTHPPTHPHLQLREVVDVAVGAALQPRQQLLLDRGIELGSRLRLGFLALELLLLAALKQGGGAVVRVSEGVEVRENGLPAPPSSPAQAQPRRQLALIAQKQRHPHEPPPPHSPRRHGDELGPRLELQATHAHQVLRDLGQPLLVLVHQELGPVNEVLVYLLQRLHHSAGREARHVG